MKVAAYYNLHKHTFSLQSRDKETYGKVIDHTDHIILKNCKFVVRESGRQKVLKEKKKNVHAFVVGDIIESVYPDNTKKGNGYVKYNPFKAGHFITEEGKRIDSAEVVVLRKGHNNKPLIGAYYK